MDHIIHIQNNKKYLDQRWEILRLLREFFWSKGFVEVETPLLLRLPGQEPYLSPMAVDLHNEKGQNFRGFLHTSPEYTLKKMLAAGYEKIFSLGKVFRDYESFGGTHNPEFTMLEWYRTNADFYSLVDDVEELFLFISQNLGNNLRYRPTGRSAGGLKKYDKPSDRTSQAIEQLEHPQRFERLHMRNVWKEYVGVNLDEYLKKDKMFELCKKQGFSPAPDETYADLFYRIFLNKIEPRLRSDFGRNYVGQARGVIIHHYPATMAALSRFSQKEPDYAERVEVYINGLELANGFSELTDAVEQKRRLEEERILRQAQNKPVYDVDEEFIDAVGNMPPSAGMALGVDRLVQYFLACQNINNVLSLPASKLF